MEHLPSRQNVTCRAVTGEYILYAEENATHGIGGTFRRAELTGVQKNHLG